MTDASLAERAELALRGSERGERFVAWDELTDLSELDLRAFLESLVAEGQRRGLEVHWRESDSFTAPGIVIRWRPARG